MKKILLATVALAALAAPAAAADLAARPTYTKAPVAAPVLTWTGFYIGAMGGYANEDADFAAMKGGFAGGTVGYNWQQGAVVFGLEADAAWADINANVGALGVNAESKIRDWGTVRGRIGYAFGPTLLYATGGYAWADNRVSLTAPGFAASDSKIHSGWTVGAGVEYMFAPNWSLKGEYLYKSFGGESYTFTGLGTLATGTLNVHSGQVGINYHF
ncbi:MULTISPECIES: porin family protein [unclassified Bradyrhizobium]|uniref:outer membrane protein n=1 Tax=unclassified Bradyrhizobium TaxID=2631580 RepID=UPI0028E2D9F2|nr:MULTISPECIES: porin family protein [unclassified Bradyrhizobium]